MASGDDAGGGGGEGARRRHVVVAGGGVIGAAVAYRLALRGVACTIVERCSPACAASGRAGGFLALDWCDSNPVVGPLARRSFELHEAFAKEVGAAAIGYRRVTTVSARVEATETAREAVKGEGAGCGAHAADNSVKAAKDAASGPKTRRRRRGLPAWVDRDGIHIREVRC